MATEIISYEFYRIIFELFKIPNENVIECYSLLRSITRGINTAADQKYNLNLKSLLMKTTNN